MYPSRSKVNSIKVSGPAMYVYIYNKSINNCQNVWMFLQDVIYLHPEPDKNNRYEETDR